LPPAPLPPAHLTGEPLRHCPTALSEPRRRRRYGKDDLAALELATVDPRSTTPGARLMLTTAGSMFSPPVPTTPALIGSSGELPSGEDEKLWREHAMLLKVSRRTQAIRRDLPPVEAPLVSGTVQSHLGEVARIRENRLHDAASPTKASHGGGFRGLDLPHFAVPSQPGSLHAVQKRWPAQ
jgi:hypothetical protein